MSDVFTIRTGRTWATHRGSPDGQLTMGDQKTEPTTPISSSAAPRDPGPAPAASADTLNPSEASRIRIDVPMGTSYLEIQASIFRQAWQHAGTQLRAAIALGIVPETISRALRACDRKRVRSPKVPQAWPAVEIDRSIGSSSHRVIEPPTTQPGDLPMNRWADVRFEDSDGVHRTPEIGEPIDEQEGLKIDD